MFGDLDWPLNASHGFVSISRVLNKIQHGDGRHSENGVITTKYTQYILSSIFVSTSQQKIIRLWWILVADMYFDREWSRDAKWNYEILNAGRMPSWKSVTDCMVGQHCYNSDVSFLWGKWERWRPVKFEPFNSVPKFVTAELIMSMSWHHKPNLVKIHSRRTSGQIGENVAFTFCFLRHAQRSDLWQILTPNGSKCTKSRKCARFWGWNI